MTTEDTPCDDTLLKAALRGAALQGWTRASLSAIAADAGVSLAEVLRQYPTRAHVLWAWGRAIDRAVLAQGVTLDERESVRDRLFDLLMRRLDALAPDKEALRALLPTFGFDPWMAGAVAMGVSRSMALTLEAAGVGASGPAGHLKVKGLVLIYSHGVRVWLDDDSPDMARTMAALDKALDRADALAGSLFARSGGACCRGKSTDLAAAPEGV
ncbi:hypothetical protein [Pararhodospirillum photometricum]|nr:hypothetical protein [Pararhodospirillum photometricum]